MFKTSFKIATAFGIPIKIHISLLLLLGLLAVPAGFAGGWGSVVFLLILETAIFISIALHELGHSLVAIRKGCHVREITLLFLGGAAQMEEIPRRPRDEIQMALAGPTVSLLLGILLIYTGSYAHLQVSWEPMPLIRVVYVQCNLIQYIGLINIGLVIFNLLPAFPMDGGRVLRALLTRRHGRLGATFIASRIGKLFGWGLGLYAFFHIGLARGWPFIAIAIFIHRAAQQEYLMVYFQETARRRAAPFWPFGDRQTNANDVSDEVTVSPPPYARKPGTDGDTDTH
jgi:Zn-dependent protease